MLYEVITTTFTFSDEVTIQGKAIPAGTYGFHIIPNEEQWILIFTSNATSWGSFAYNPEEDVRQLQLAKGAVRAGIEVLLDRAGLADDEIAVVLITGAFGSALPVAAVKGIALLPESMLDKLFCVPNGVLDGLAVFLADQNGPERLKALHAAIKSYNFV